MNNVQQQTITAKNELYVQIGKFLGMLPSIWGMARDEFEAQLAENLDYDNGTVHNWISKKMTSTVTYTQLSTAVLDIFDAFINDPEIDPEVRETAKRNHDLCGKTTLELIHRLYLAAEILKIAKPLQSDANKMMVTINLFMHGRWPEHDGLSAEEAEWLRQCLNQFPPKCLHTDKMTTNANAVEQFVEDNN